MSALQHRLSHLQPSLRQRWNVLLPLQAGTSWAALRPLRHASHHSIMDSGSPGTSRLLSTVPVGSCLGAIYRLQIIAMPRSRGTRARDPCLCPRPRERRQGTPQHSQNVASKPRCPQHWRQSELCCHSAQLAVPAPLHWHACIAAQSGVSTSRRLAVTVYMIVSERAIGCVLDG